MRSDAEKWIHYWRNNAVVPVVENRYDFSDGSRVQWSGTEWFVAFMERVEIPKGVKTDAENTIRDKTVGEILSDAHRSLADEAEDYYKYKFERLNAITKGTKTDTSKPRWSLLPADTITQVIAVLEFGAAKYRVNNWQHVPDARTRYYDATMRHIESWFRGERDDSESGLPHLAHACCCILFLMWLDKEKK